MLGVAARLAGRIEIDPTPQEVPWTAPLDEDHEHRTYDPERAADYFAAATQAALVLAAFRAPYRGRSTPVNAWWGSFDLAVNLYSGHTAEPPSSDFIMRNAMDAQEVAVGWWPGDSNHARTAFYAYAHPAPDGFAAATLSPGAARWEEALGESSTGTTSAPHPIRRALPSNSPGRRFATPARYANGTRHSPPVPKANRPLSAEHGARRHTFPRMGAFDNSVIPP